MNPPALPSNFMGEAYVVAGIPSGEPVVRNVALKIYRDTDTCQVMFGGDNGVIAVYDPSSGVFVRSGIDIPESTVEGWVLPILRAAASTFGVDVETLVWYFGDLVGNTPTYTLRP